MGGKKKKINQADIVVPPGDPQIGKGLFKNLCASCHSMDGDGKGAGAPPLSKLLGRKAGSTSYEYSSAIKNSGVVWTKQALFLYLKTPSQYISGNKMSFGGMPSEDDRANIIAYFEDQSS